MIRRWLNWGKGIISLSGDIWQTEILETGFHFFVALFFEGFGDESYSYFATVLLLPYGRYNGLFSVLSRTRYDVFDDVSQLFEKLKILHKDVYCCGY